jgi:hypothetical protein
MKINTPYHGRSLRINTCGKTHAWWPRWFGVKILRYQGLAKAYAWHILLAVMYNLRRMPRLYVECMLARLPQGKSA